jgi:hypothetical protein
MDLWRQRVSRNGSLSGDAEQITSGMLMRHASFTIGGDRLTFSRGQSNSNVWRFRIMDRPATWADAEQVTRDRDLVMDVDPSSDGSRLALGMTRYGNT